MLLHRLNEAFPALCSGPESPDEPFTAYAARLSGELTRLRNHPVGRIVFPFFCPLDFLLLFPLPALPADLPAFRPVGASS